MILLLFLLSSQNFHLIDLFYPEPFPRTMFLFLIVLLVLGNYGILPYYKF